MQPRSQRFRFYEDAGTTDTTTGVHTEDWSSEVCTRWAAALPESDNAFAALRARHGFFHLGLVLAYDATALTLSPAHRAVWVQTGREFEIVGVIDPDGMHREIHIALAERFITRNVTS